MEDLFCYNTNINKSEVRFMGFTPKLIFADICLIISIILALYINKSVDMPANIKVALIVVALILLVISIVINLSDTFKKIKKQKK